MVKRGLCIILLFCLLLLGVVGCSDNYDLTGKEVLGLPEEFVTSYTVRHAGQSLFFSYEEPLSASKYRNLLNSVMMRKSNREGTLDSDIYEIYTMYTVDHFEENSAPIFDVCHVNVIVSGDMIRYNDQWYEADTSRLLRQLEKDFS